MMVEGLITIAAIVVYDQLRIQMVRLGLNLPFLGITVLDILTAIVSIILFARGSLSLPKTKLS